MSVRAAAPHPVKAAGRTVSVRLGTATAARRQLPSFLLVGAQRAGTTSLFRALLSHPLVFGANYHKGVNYFDVNYDRGPAWYRGHFPTVASVERRAGGRGRAVTFEASGYYMFHPWALSRLTRDLPEVRLVAMLRDPVERAYSAWKHELARGYETESFERALELEDERLSGQRERMLADPGYQSFSHRHHAYVRRGQYDEQLRRMYQLVGRERVHVVESELFFTEPEETYGRLLAFLDLPPLMPGGFDRWNARPSAAMPAATRAHLREHFAGHDEALAGLLGREAAWMT